MKIKSIVERYILGPAFLLAMLLVAPLASDGAEEGKTIKIGILGPMKFSLGQGQWASAEMAAEEINAAGGITIKGVKHKIELVKKDDNSEVSLVDALNAMKSLLTVDEVDFVVGGHRSESVLAMMDIVAKNKKIFVNTGAGHPEIMVRVGKNYDKYKYMFRLQANNKTITPYLLIHTTKVPADAIREQLGIAKPKVAILIEKTLAGNAFVRASKAILPKMGLEIVGEWRPSATATDMTAELTAIKASGAHVIFGFFPGPAGVALSRGFGELQVPVVLGGVNGQAQRKSHWENTGGLCNYEVVSGPIGRCEITEKTVPYYDKFYEKVGDFPEYSAPPTYDALFILKDAIERAGTTESDAVVAAMEKTDYRGAIGRVVFQPKGHETPHDYIMGPDHLLWVGSQWQDGKLVPVSPNGRIAMGDKRWKGLRYKGTVDYKIPPWTLKYWKDKK